MNSDARVNYRQWIRVLSIIIVLGFIPSYAVSFQFIPVLYHIHAVIAFLWIIAVNLQTHLISLQQVALHRITGYGSVILGCLFTISTTALFLTRLIEKDDKPPIYHLVYWLDLFLIPTFFVILLNVFLQRKSPQNHKLMVVLMMIVLLPPGLGRLIYTIFLHPFDLDVRYFYELMILVTLCCIGKLASILHWQNASVRRVLGIFILAFLSSYPVVYRGYF